MAEATRPRKPKPREGLWRRIIGDWPAFVREIIIVVVGILLALTLDQIVSNMTSAARLKTTEAGLRDEIQANLAFAYERKVLQSCTDARLDKLSAAVIGNNRAAIENLGQRGPIAARPWRSSAWQSALSADIADQLPRERLAVYTHIYAGIDAEAARQFGMRDLAFEASAGRYGISLSNDARVAQLVAIRKLQAEGRLSAIIAGQMLPMAKAKLRIEPTRKAVAFYNNKAAECRIAP